MLSVLSILTAARRAALDVEALVLPMACLGCERALPDGRVGGPLCDVCRLALRPIAPPRCRRCGQTLDSWEMADGRWRMAERPGVRPQQSSANRHLPSDCGFCRQWPEALAWAASAVWFEEGPARALVYALKYGGWRVAALPMAAVMARALGARLRGADALVPVPLGRRRRRERGHNQAELLAGELARACGVAALPDALERPRETRTQTALHPDERRSNVAGAFRALRPLVGRRVILVDDVLTTGATLAAAAEALAAAGAAEVGAVSFARAPKPGE